MHPPHHMHASHNLAQQGQRGRGEGVACGLCPAILLSSFLPLHPLTLVTGLGLSLAYTLTWCHCGRRSGQGGRGCLCWKGRCDQQPGTWKLWAAGLSQAHPTISSQEDPLQSGEKRAGSPTIFRSGSGDAKRANLIFGCIN